MWCGIASGPFLSSRILGGRILNFATNFFKWDKSRFVKVELFSNLLTRINLDQDTGKIKLITTNEQTIRNNNFRLTKQPSTILHILTKLCSQRSITNKIQPSGCMV